MSSFNYSDNKVKFSYFNHENGVFFDEKTKSFVDFRDMDEITYRRYNSPFKTVNFR